MIIQETKIRCTHSELYLKSHIVYDRLKNRKGYIIRESGRLCYVVLWDGRKNGQYLRKDFLIIIEENNELIKELRASEIY